jgi:hypothetical protein
MNPIWDFTWWISAVVAGDLGDKEKVREALANLSTLKPEASIAFPAFGVVVDPARHKMPLLRIGWVGAFPVSDIPMFG